MDLEIRKDGVLMANINGDYKTIRTDSNGALRVDLSLLDEPARMRFEANYDFKVGDVVLFSRPDATFSFLEHLDKNPYVGLKGYS